MRTPLYLGAALDGLGAHPAAWRLTGTPPEALFDPERVVALARLAEQGGLDLVTLDDQVPATPEPGHAHGSLDAWLALTLAACRTSRIALFPTGVARGEPAATAARAVTLDRIAGGRGGWRPRVALSDDERRRATADPERYAAFTEERFAHAEEFVASVAAFWDSRREESVLSSHAVDLSGDHLAVSGHARVPTPPSGPPMTAVLAHFSTPFRLAARHADLVFVTPFSRADVDAVREELDGLCAALGRTRAPLAVLADLDVVVAGTESEAAERRDRLDRWIPFTSDCATFTGTPEQLADLMAEWHRDGGVDGFRIRPAVLSDDLTAVVETVVPCLRKRGLLDDAPRVPLRARLFGASV
ncbi:LLM class flavin-dependent oxidoreductase [Streptomyces griseoviridis]|jgi:alkanesulfonate monooxygenase SsuD/methylene tetrahydromethanopterin reductase-like flavin-dependent oxidoreductase (luciferase family)|uniref:FMNH2-utilizing oxygenase n=2 Tax=Streptomyces griseoviridis TaxID=45398 RepID=A0A918LI01_STRGD|nr:MULTISPECIES: LLM class flavin-dependent oxidoreductase [Streptomyces]MDP9680242.1 alkanesulfonate monooxygenase SsuD/methylene tetrahydromethanopterin reductase-like flavin-dependent oxidoreductase (luciferase family) [Streptomyces griseoviridis]GGS50216.1 FMNH2-utilizing oxygenase [Streptomyces niveoruber]GGT13697.1 FMNH2-utilizing oxygenase [Streptomyces griseoviridis]